MEIQKFKVGNIVRVARTKSITGPKKQKAAEAFDTAPTIGRIVWAHPLHIFYTVEFRDRYTAEYKPLYRESFFPEQLEKIHQPNFMRTRPAKKRSWAKEA